jgi:cytochrome c556
MSEEFDEIKKVNDELLHVAKEFKFLFPEGSQGGKASSLIWEDRETFNLYVDNFINSIEDIAASIKNKDSVSLMRDFTTMSANCGTCHKKFKN